MPINPGGGNGFSQALIDIMEQPHFLERKIRESLLPTYVFRPKVVDARDWFDANIGETKTFTRRALIAPNTTPLNPADNTGLDNGMTADARSFEQWTATLTRWPGFIPTNITGQEALIADLYLDNVFAIAQKAGSSLELVCAQRIWQAYDSGDSFINTIGTGVGTVAVDNVNGFITQFSATDLPNYGTPKTVTSANKMPVAIVSGTTGFITYLTNVNAYTIDAPNKSYMQNGGFSFGQSGTLTLDNGDVTVAVGDRIVAIDPSAALAANPPTVGAALNPVWKDGSYVVRPLNTGGTMIMTAAAMAATNILAPTAMIPYAVSVAKRRGIPKLKNGLYGCAIDSTLLGQLYQDDGFSKATATNWDRSRVFRDGIIAAGWGVEFTESTQVPTYAAPGNTFQLRHGFVFGEDVISEHPFKGVRDATAIVASVGDVADTRFADRIKFRTLAAIDTLGDVIKLAYDYIGDFQPGTDKSSNPTLVQASDYMRYKRGVMFQAASAF